MTYRGRVKDGVVVLQEGVTLAEGTEVQVGVVQAPTELPAEGPSLLDRLSRVVGKAKGLPKDAAQNVEHYLYGMPKR